VVASRVCRCYGTPKGRAVTPKASPGKEGKTGPLLITNLKGKMKLEQLTWVLWGRQKWTKRPIKVSSILRFHRKQSSVQHTAMISNV